MKRKKENKGFSFIDIFDGLIILTETGALFASNKLLLGIVLSISLFMILYELINIIFCISICYKKYLRDKTKLIEQCKVDANKKSSYLYELDSLERKAKRCFFKVYFPVRGKSLLVFIGAVMLICISDTESVKAFYNNLKTLITFESKEEDEDKQDLDSEEEKQEENVTSELQVKQRKDPKWRFVLDYQDESKFINFEREQEVFFYNSNVEDMWETYVLDCVKEIYNEERRGVDYKTIRDEYKNTFYTYTELEDAFKDRIEEIIDYQYYDDWMEDAPHSTELDYYISGREYLNQIEFEGEMGCYKIWYQLANDYQYYAQEYEWQTNNERAVRYYYINSIYCCMQGLKYSVSEEDKDNLYHYMVMRYHDMADEQSVIPDKDREKAFKIYSLLVKRDRLSKFN